MPLPRSVTLSIESGERLKEERGKCSAPLDFGIDRAIIVAYVAAVLIAGIAFGRRQHTTRQYFLASHNVPWWAIAASIVATETSTITFISVPGLVWAAGGDFRFLQ